MQQTSLKPDAALELLDKYKYLPKIPLVVYNFKDIVKFNGFNLSLMPPQK